MADFSESTSPNAPFQTISPDNFRRVMQNQIASHVKKEVDGVTAFSKGNSDGRFANSRPSTVTYMSNIHGFHYFIVGSSIVGLGCVAAP